MSQSRRPAQGRDANAKAGNGPGQDWKVLKEPWEPPVPVLQPTSSGCPVPRVGRSRKREKGELEMKGGTHQDVSLQEQSWLDGDADAGLTVSRDVAKGQRGTEKDRAAGGVGDGKLSLCPSAHAAGTLPDFLPSSLLRSQGGLPPTWPGPWPWALAILPSGSHRTLTRCQTCTQAAWPGRCGEKVDTLSEKGGVS